jgi:hypothetical protein
MEGRAVRDRLTKALRRLEAAEHWLDRTMMLSEFVPSGASSLSDGEALRRLLEDMPPEMLDALAHLVAPHIKEAFVEIVKSAAESLQKAKAAARAAALEDL